MTGYDQVPSMTETRMGDSLGISEAWELSCTEVICGRYVFLSQVSLTRRRRGDVENDNLIQLSFCDRSTAFHSLGCAQCSR